MQPHPRHRGSRHRSSPRRPPRRPRPGHYVSRRSTSFRAGHRGRLGHRGRSWHRLRRPRQLPRHRQVPANPCRAVRPPGSTRQGTRGFHVKQRRGRPAHGQLDRHHRPSAGPVGRPRSRSYGRHRPGLRRPELHRRARTTRRCSRQRPTPDPAAPRRRPARSPAPRGCGARTPTRRRSLPLLCRSVPPVRRRPGRDPAQRHARPRDCVPRARRRRDQAPPPPTLLPRPSPPLRQPRGSAA